MKFIRYLRNIWDFNLGFFSSIWMLIQMIYTVKILGEPFFIRYDPGDLDSD